jgi:hypothetical protein
MLHPSQFQVNEAWIAFKLNDFPIHTEQDGDFDFIALMDAASCFILGYASAPAARGELSAKGARHLLREGQSHKQKWPKTLFLPADQPAQFLSKEAKRKGITVVPVAEDQLLVFTGEAKQGFRERIGGSR